MFNKVLIANRGAIACRIIRTLRRLGIASVAIYSRADAHSLHVVQADESHCIGEAAASESYLQGERIIALAKACGAEAIHPGYGFLSENAAFAERCEAEGIVFLGPTAEQMRLFGLKHTARDLAMQSGVPLLPGSELLQDLEQAISEATRIGYPLMLKSTAGGGGIGMQLCEDEATLRQAFDSVRRLSENNFANGGIFLEKFVTAARHIEVQLFGDGQGEVIALGERDCSLQRRNQKVVEETPAPGLPESVRTALLATAEALGKQVHYRSAGTVEFIVDAHSHDFYFLEVNTRLQVEHGVTEAVYAVDLVEWMLRCGAGELGDLAALRPSDPNGHAIQVRLYAEDPGKAFQPASGLLTEAAFPTDCRVDTWVERGSEITPWYDPMIAKLIVHGSDREDALGRLQQALAATTLAGLETNLDYLRRIASEAVFAQGQQTTRYLNDYPWQADTIEVLAAGTQSTVQDWPGRVGYWDIGVPPSGPMDSLAFRLGNRLLGNPEGAAGLELTVNGPTLRFHTDTHIVLCGAEMAAELNGEPLGSWQVQAIRRGQTLRLGAVQGGGARSYLLIQGGIQVPDYLGSKATFTLGQFGGHGGRPLRPGDVLHIPPGTVHHGSSGPIQRPAYGRHWTLHVVYGPHGAPDFFTPADIETFFATDWAVHYNSSRTGVRLIGPKPEWARRDGGEAGLHPSNIHDNAYAIGAVDFTGDMPVILGPDGPSLGGFVCPATVISADLWKLGQLRPDDSIRFVPVSIDTACRLANELDQAVATLCAPQPTVEGIAPHSAVLARRLPPEHPVGVCYRPAGDRYLLVEYGEAVLDLELRFRVQALLEWLHEQAIPGIIEMTPGVRSLQIHYEPRQLSLSNLLERLGQAETALRDLSEVTIPSRIVHLPLAWDDSQTRLAIDKYMQSVRQDAPWCPSNIEFIRRINGLESEQQVKEIVYAASYLVMGLGDVYLSAPLATPLDPRHRLVTTKYNPARTWTPENAVGIGGSYMCIYGMEGPGGYQFVGRTLQMWSRYHQTAEFEHPWLLRFFDQIRFYEVSEEALLVMREDFPRGRCHIEIEESQFSLSDYKRFLEDNRSEIQAFKSRQQAAFEAERARWAAAGQVLHVAEEEPVAESEDALALGADQFAVQSHVHGNIWQIPVAVGDTVEAGQPLLVIESMKMEIVITAEQTGTIEQLLCSEGKQVTPGQHLLVLKHPSQAKEKQHA